MNTLHKLAILALTILTPMLLVTESSAKTKPLKALIVTGQNNHNWPVSHIALQLILQQSDMFDCDIAQPLQKGAI